MHNDPIYLLQPVFRFLDGLIDAYGDWLYLLLVFVSIPLIVWILSGGLRRRMRRNDSVTCVSVIIVRSAVQKPPSPPIIGDLTEGGPPDDDGSSFAA